MSDNMIVLVAAFLAAAPGLVALIIQFFKLGIERKKLQTETNKTEAETAGEIGDAWKDLLEPYRQEVSRLNGLIVTQKCRIDELEERVKIFEEILSGAHRLYSQLKAHQIAPVWQPPERREDLKANTKPTENKKEG